MASINLQGDTSGAITISAPSVAGSNTLTLPATTQTLATQNALGVRNLIINGDMRIAQRGTSVTGITSSGYYTVDRFTLFATTAGTWTHTQDTDVPTGQGFSKSFKMQCTTANASLSSTSGLFVRQRIEAQNLQHIKKGTASAESLTYSFWVKSNKTGTYIAEIFDDDNVRQISKAYTINAADTWEKKVITFAGDTSGSLPDDNGSGFSVALWFVAGTNYTSNGTLNTSWQSTNVPQRAVGQVNLADSTSNYINITGVQLEVGDTATPFEHRPWDDELIRCMRYYEKCINYSTVEPAGGYTGVEWVDIPRDKTANLAIKDIKYKVRKRAAATVNFWSLNQTVNQFGNVYSGVDIGNAGAIWGSEQGFTWRNESGGTVSASTHNGLAVLWAASSEL